MSWGSSIRGLFLCYLEQMERSKGNLQSPINIETAQAKEGNSVGPVQFKYISIRDSTITNDGRQLRITLTRNESGMKKAYYMFD